MSARTVLQLALAATLAVALGGLGLGFAQGWGGEVGVAGMWSAALIGFLAAAAAIGMVGILRDVGQRPSYAPPALHWALGVWVLVAASASTLLFVLRPAPTTQLATWVGVHCVLQGALLFLFFRRGAGPSDAL